MLAIIPLLLTLCTTTWAKDTIYQTAIAIKQGVQDFTESISLGASSYNELVQKSKIFIDNSLFIKEALTTNQQWYIIGPRKYGKTLNVDMLKTFLEMRVDDNGNRITPVESSSAYKLFANGEITSDVGGATHKLESPLLISKHKDLVQKYLGNHPVIYISFKNVKGNTSEEVDATMGDTIKGAFLQHKYMIDILRRKKQQEEIEKPATLSINVTTSINATSDNTTSNLTRFEQILEDTHGRKFLEYDSIRYLTQVLYEHFNKTVFVIFDDFDKPFSMTIHMEQFPRMHYEDIIRYMDNLAAETFKQNNYLLNGIVVSTFQLHQYGNYHLWDIYTLVDLLMHSHPIIQYFGFSHKDVQSLFDKHKLPSDLSQQAVKWYNGFKSFNLTRNTYNPHSIASFLQHKKLANYFNHQEERILAEKLISINLLTRNRFLSLVNGRHILIQRRTQLNEFFVLHLKMAKGIYAYRDFIWYLFRTGYLCATDDYMYFKIPNNEISEEISNWMISNYQREYNITENLLQDSATKLLEFVTDKSSTASALESSLSDLYNLCSYPNLTTFKTIPLVFDPYRLIFTTVALKMRSLSSYEINVYSNKTLKADAVIASNQTNQIFILEINHTDEPIDSSLKLAKKYEQNVTLFLNHLTKVKLVAVKIYPNKTVQIVSKSKDEVILER